MSPKRPPHRPSVPNPKSKASPTGATAQRKDMNAQLLFLCASVPRCEINWLRRLASLIVLTVFGAHIAPLLLAEQPVASVSTAPLQKIDVFPPAIQLSGPRSRTQLVVTGHYPDGSVRDVTRECQIASTANEVAFNENAVVLPRRNGKAELTVIAGG